MFTFSHLFYLARVQPVKLLGYMVLLKLHFLRKVVVFGQLLVWLVVFVVLLFALPSLMFSYLTESWCWYSWGIECAIHATHCFLSLYGDDDSLALLKVDMKNAFNDCSRHAFFACELDDFPGISAWVK